MTKITHIDGITTHSRPHVLPLAPYLLNLPHHNEPKDCLPRHVHRDQRLFIKVLNAFRQARTKVQFSV